MSEISLPEGRLPTVRMRRVKLPDITIPEIKARGRPLRDVKIPDLKINEARTPDVKVSRVKIPGIDLSDFKAPDMQRAGQLAAEVNMPDMKVREVKMPDIKLPDVQMPDLKIPDVKLGDIKLSDALSAISMPDVKIPTLPDRSDLRGMLPRREAPSPVPFILVGALTGILLGLWLATVAPTSSWIRMTADDLKTRFDRWRAGPADALGDRMDEYLAPAPVPGAMPVDSTGFDMAGMDRPAADRSKSPSSPAFTGTASERIEESTSSH